MGVQYQGTGGYVDWVGPTLPYHQHVFRWRLTVEVDEVEFTTFDRDSAGRVYRNFVCGDADWFGEYEAFADSVNKMSPLLGGFNTLQSTIQFSDGHNIWFGQAWVSALNTANPGPKAPPITGQFSVRGSGTLGLTE